jgi:hypothetical protein
MTGRTKTLDCTSAARASATVAIHVARAQGADPDNCESDEPHVPAGTMPATNCIVSLLDEQRSARRATGTFRTFRVSAVRLRWGE